MPKIDGESESTKTADEGRAVLAVDKKLIVYVPQGFSARFTKETQFRNIIGLYTDQFSTCNIIVCINVEKTRLVLIHVDIQTMPLKIEAEIEWVGKNCEIVILYRDTGQHVLQQILEHLKPKISSGIKLTQTKIDNLHDGIYVSLELQTKNNVHPHIAVRPILDRPDGLIHHPQEEQILTVQKIEQVIGLAYRWRTHTNREKQLCIFNANAWEPLNKEIVVDTSNKQTKQEMDFFNPDDELTTICGKVAGIVQDCVKHKMPIFGELKDIATSVGPYIETYLNEYNYKLIFKRDLKEVINAYKATSSKDQIFKKQLISILNLEKEDVFKEVSDLLTQYNATDDKSEFKKNILAGVKKHIKLYQERLYYHNKRVELAKGIEKAKKLHTDAIGLYQLKKHAEAHPLFLEAMRTFTYFSIQNNPHLAIACYNYGKNLFEMNEHLQEACVFIEFSRELGKKYPKSKASKEELEKKDKSLNDCKSKLEAYSTEAQRNLLMYGLMLTGDKANPANLIMEYSDFLKPK